MTRAELITEWCAAEGGKKSALDAPQAREAWAKLRAIIGSECGIDLDDVINGRSLFLEVFTFSKKYKRYEAFPVHVWRNGKPVKK